MKRLKLLVWTLAIILAMNAKIAKAQVSTPNNFGFPGNYVGWNAGQNFPLQIRHDGNYPINIYTNGSQRMSIRPNGRVGINSANPLSLSI